MYSSLIWAVRRLRFLSQVATEIPRRRHKRRGFPKFRLLCVCSDTRLAEAHTASGRDWHWMMGMHMLPIEVFEVFLRGTP